MSDTTAELVKKYICDGDIEYHDNIFVDAIETYKHEVKECQVSGVTNKEESQGVFYLFNDCSIIGCFSSGLLVASPAKVLEGYMRKALEVRKTEVGIERIKHDA